MLHLHTILVADDEPDLREMMVAAFAEEGYAALAAADGFDAVRVLADNWVNLLITDVRMPGISGFELSRQAKVMRPQISVIYLSGYPQDKIENGLVNGPVIMKPFRMCDLIAEVRHLLS